MSYSSVYFVLKRVGVLTMWKSKTRTRRTDTAQHIYVNLQISLLSGEVLQVQQEDGTFSADGSWGETKTTI